ncbi:RNA-binding S4 domain-containing protein [Thalassotalea piscium]
MDKSTLEIELASQPIELCKLLKAVDLVSGGGEAKMVISEGYVFLNGEVETQKRKKIYHNDRVDFNGESILVICHAPVESHPVKKAPQPKQAPKHSSAKKNSKKPSKNNKTTKNSSNKVEKAINDNSGMRKPINF